MLSHFKGDTKDVANQFFFIFENTVAHGANETEIPYELHEFINEKALELFYNSFSTDVVISKQDMVYRTLRKDFLDICSLQ